MVLVYPVEALDTFRVTEYYITTPMWSSTATNYTLSLSQPLAPDYFILVRGARAGDGTGVEGDKTYVRVDQVPGGFGALIPSGSDTKIRLARYEAGVAWEGVVTVVECWGDADRSGFRLLDIMEMDMAAGATSGSKNPAKSWTDIDQVVPFGGYRGGGAQLRENIPDARRNVSVYTRVYPTDPNKVQWRRAGDVSYLRQAVMTVFLVEWGSEWTVTRTVVSGTNYGPGVDETGEYTAVSCGATLARDRTWVWGTGNSTNLGSGNSAEGCVVTLGDGVAQNATEYKVAVGSDESTTYNFDVYTMTHPDLQVAYRFKPDGDPSFTDMNVTVDYAPTDDRMGWAYNSCDGIADTDFPMPICWSRYTANTNMVLSRGASGKPFAAWAQGVHFGAITHPDWLPGYRYRTIIDTPPLALPEELTDFPLLIASQGTVLTNRLKHVSRGGHVAHTNGWDILLTDWTGTNKLDHEIEGYDENNGWFTGWVRVPTILTNKPTMLFLYYGKRGMPVPQENGPSVWTNGYEAVWHLGELSGTTYLDSGPGGHHGSAYGSAPTPAPAVAGIGQAFNATGNIGVPYDDALNPTTFTASCWARVDVDTGATRTALASRKNQHYGYNILAMERSPSADEWRANIYDGSGGDTLAKGNVQLGQWVYLVLCYSNKSATFYANLAAAGPYGIGEYAPNDTNPFWIGCGGDATPIERFNGPIDEVRISSVVRSPAWIALSYTNQASPQTTAMAGEEEAQPVLMVSSVSVAEPDPGPTNAVFTITVDIPILEDVTFQYVTSNKTASAGEDYLFTSGVGTIPVGQTSTTVSVPIYGDEIYEMDEEFLLLITNVFNALPGDNSGFCTILADSDPYPELSITDVIVTEGDTPDTTNAVFDVWITNPCYTNISCYFHTSNDTAFASSDYLATNGMFTITAGQTNAAVTVTVNGDDIDEGPQEYFFVYLSNAVAAKINDSRGECMIVGDETSWISISNAVVLEGDSGTTTAAFEVVLSCENSLTVSVMYTTLNGTALGEADYVPTNAFIEIPPGGTVGTGTVEIIGDQTGERPYEWLSLYLSEPEFSLISNAWATCTIVDDDVNWAPGFQHRLPITISSNAVSATLTNFPLLISSAGTTVTNELKHVESGGRVCHPQGWDILFADATGENLLDYEHELYITNSGAYVGWVRVPELRHDADTTIWMFYGSPWVDSTMENLSSLWADYHGVWHMNESPADPSPQMLNSAGGTNDGACLGAMSTAVLGPAQIGQGLHLDGLDDYVAVPGLPVGGTTTLTVSAWFQPDTDGNDMCVAAKDSLGIDTPLALWRDDSGAQSLRSDIVSVRFSDGLDYGDIEGSDNTAVKLQWVHAAGTFVAKTTGGIRLYVDGVQDAYSPSNSFAVDEIRDATYPFWIGNATDSGTCFDGTLDEIRVCKRARSGAWIAACYSNQVSPATFAPLGSPESLPVLTVSLVGSPMPESNGTATVTVHLSEQCTDPVTTWLNLWGSATQDEDYTNSSQTILFRSGETNATFTLYALDDTLDDEAEQIVVNIANPSSGAVPGWPNEVTAEITDDDVPALWVEDLVVDEGDSGTSFAVFQVLLSSTAAQTVTVNYATQNGSADDMNDFTATWGTMVLPPGVRTGTVVVSVHGDTSYEGAGEHFLLKISNPQNATIEANTASCWIRDDDGLWKSGYAYRLPIVVPAHAVVGTLEDFPLLVDTRGTPATNVLKHTASGGHVEHAQGWDMLLTDYTGTNRLDHEIELYQTNSGVFVAWTRVPELDGGLGTLLWLYYGKSSVSASPENVAGVWDEHYLAVWHLAETPGGAPDMVDSTGNGYDGTTFNMGSSDQVDAKIDGGLNFDALDDYIALPEGFSDFTGGLTFELWAYPTTDSEYWARFIELARGEADHNILFARNGTSENVTFEVFAGASSGEVTTEGCELQTNVWQYWVATETDAGFAAIYKDGVGLADGTVPVPANVNRTTNFIAESNWPLIDGEYGGMLDEVRISDIARSPEWIAACHSNQAAPATFAAPGLEQPLPVLVHLELTGSPLAESNTAAQAFVWAVLSDTTDVPVTVQLDSEGSAEYQEDYTAPDGPIVVPAGSWSNALPITAVDDFLVEAEETIIAFVADVVNARQSESNAVAGSILDNDIEWTHGFRYRIPITISSNAVSATLSNFPFLVNTGVMGTWLTNELKHVGYGGHVEHPAGFDIVFSEGDMFEQLDHEVEGYWSAVGALAAWVRIPVLRHDADTTIWMYYGNPSLHWSTERREHVWTNNYVLVWHLNEPEGLVDDSTFEDIDGSPANGLIQDVGGAIAGGVRFDGHDDFITIGEDDLPPPYTIELLVQREDSPNSAAVVNWPTDGTDSFRLEQFNNTDKIGFTRSGVADYSFGYEAPTDTWTYVAFRATNAMTHLFANGTMYGGGIADAITCPMGMLGRNELSLKGYVDEVRISDCARSDAWIAACFSNMASPFTFASFDAPELAVAPAATLWCDFGPLDENAGTAKVHVVLSVTSDLPVTVTLGFGGEAVRGVDYACPDTVIVPAGQTNAIVELVGLDDNKVEGKEWFSVWIAYVEHGTGGLPGWFDHYIRDDDAFWKSGYRYRVPITVRWGPDRDPLENFPLLVSTVDTPLTNALKHVASDGHIENTNGWDLMFTTWIGTNQLDHEIEMYGTNTGVLVAWVRIPYVGGDVPETPIWMYYGKSGVDRSPENVNGVWDEDFLAVWHMGKARSELWLPQPWLPDSTAYANSAFLFGPITNAPPLPGRIGGCRYFGGDAARDYAEADNSEAWDLITEELTLEAWVRRETTNAMTLDTIVGRQFETGPEDAWHLAFQNDTNEFAVHTSVHGWDGIVRDMKIAPTGEWIHVAGSWDGVWNRLQINGEEVNIAPNDAMLPNLENPVQIASAITNGTQRGQFFPGHIDELRISRIERHDDWILACHSNQANPAAFAPLGPEQAIPTVVTLSISTGNGLFPSLPESNGTARVVATLAATTDVPVVVTCQVEGSAMLDEDYTSSSNAIVVPAGAWSNWITLTAIDDWQDEPDETIEVLVVEIENGRPGESNAVQAVLLDDDAVWPAGYRYRMPIVISSNVTWITFEDFPLLVATEGTHATNELKNVGNDAHVFHPEGWDIVFAPDGEPGLLDFEMETYNGAEGILFAWVRIPELTYEHDTLIWMYYGKTGVTESEENREGVWDEDFVAVWHLHEQQGLQHDSTGNGYDAMPTNRVAQGVPGLIGGADAFDGDNDYLAVYGENVPDEWMAEMWVLRTNSTRTSAVLMDSDAYSLRLEQWSDTEEVGYSEHGVEDRTWGYKAPTNEWTHLAFLGDSGDPGSMRLVVNGTYYGHNDGNLACPMQTIGNSAVSFLGVLDELRVSRICRSFDWIKLCWSNQLNPNAFAVLGGAEEIPVVTLAATNSPVAETNGTAGLVVSLSRAFEQEVVIDIEFGGTATAGVDYSNTANRIVFTPGNTNETITITPIDDCIDETDETVAALITNVINAEVSAAAGGTVTITDDDFPALAILDTSVLEGDSGTTTAVFTVAMSCSSISNVTVDYSPGTGSALLSQDYAWTNGTLLFAPGSSTGFIYVAVYGDTLDEGASEYFGMDIFSPVNASNANSSGTCTIVDDDFPAVTIADTSVMEGHSGTTDAVFLVTLSCASVSNVTMRFDTVDGLATAGADYRGTNGTLTIAPSVTTGMLVVPVYGDTSNEWASEWFFLDLNSPTNAVLLDARAECMILEDDLTVITPAVEQHDGATGVTDSGATLRGKVTAGAPTPRAFVYYGPNDGTTNKSAWEHVVYVGIADGAFASNVTGTAIDEVWYYRCYVSNYVADAWAQETGAWSMQQRETNTWYLASVPVQWGDGQSNNLNATLGAQLASGLPGGTDKLNSDCIWLWSTDRWAQYYVRTNGVWMTTNDTPANITIEPGTGFWLKRLHVTSAENTVFVGLPHTNSVQTTFPTNAWTIFAWPYDPRHESEGGTGSDRGWGFANAGGTGSYSWQYADNIIGYEGPDQFNLYLGTNGNWYYRGTSTRADIKLKPGRAYYYFHRGTGSFSWTPPKD